MLENKIKNKIKIKIEKIREILFLVFSEKLIRT